MELSIQNLAEKFLMFETIIIESPIHCGMI